MELLEIKHLHVAFGEDKQAKEILHDIHFTLRQGECVGIMGASGSGKSQFVQSILGLSKGQITQGELYWNKQQVPRSKWKTLCGSEIFLILQDAKLALHPNQTIEKQLKEYASFLHPKQKITQEQLISLLKQVHIQDPQHVLQSYPYALSLGMCQRIQIAFLLLSPAKVWILDEVCSALDRIVQAEIVELLRRLQKEKQVAMIFITHDIRLVHQLCQRCYIMEEGILRKEDTMGCICF